MEHEHGMVQGFLFHRTAASPLQSLHSGFYRRFVSCPSVSFSIPPGRHAIDCSLPRSVLLMIFPKKRMDSADHEGGHSRWS